LKFEVGFAQGQSQKEKEDLDFFGQEGQEGQDFFSYPVYPVNPVQKTNFLNLSFFFLGYCLSLRAFVPSCEKNRIIPRLPYT
jgi:hypothetical protein